MSATLSLSLISVSWNFLNPLEVALALPVCDRLVVGGGLGAVEMRVVLDHVRAEGALREIAPGEPRDRFVEAVGDPRQVLGRVDVPGEHLGGLDPVADAIQPRCE